MSKKIRSQWRVLSWLKTANTQTHFIDFSGCFCTKDLCFPFIIYRQRSVLDPEPQIPPATQITFFLSNLDKIATQIKEGILLSFYDQANYGIISALLVCCNSSPADLVFHFKILFKSLSKSHQSNVILSSAIKNRVVCNYFTSN